MHIPEIAEYKIIKCIKTDYFQVLDLDKEFDFYVYQCVLKANIFELDMKINQYAVTNATCYFFDFNEYKLLFMHCL